MTNLKKSDVSMVRGSSNKEGVTYTIGFSSIAIANTVPPLFIKDGLKQVDKKIPSIKATKSGKIEVRFFAKEQAIIRTAIRKVKDSGIAIYKGQAPKYVATATEPVRKIALSLGKKAAKVAKPTKKTAVKVIKKADKKK